MVEKEKEKKLRANVIEVTRRVEMGLFGTRFVLRSGFFPGTKRMYIQVRYLDKCRDTGELESFGGRKYALSKHMTKDEIVKTAWVAFERAVKHEMMEGFTVDGKVLFNPHTDFEELLKVSDKIVKRGKLPNH